MFLLLIRRLGNCFSWVKKMNGLIPLQMCMPAVHTQLIISSRHPLWYLEGSDLEEELACGRT